MKLILTAAIFTFLNISTAVSASDIPSDTIVITLEEAIIGALENNPSILVQRSDVKVAKGNIKRARAEFEPVLSARVSKNRIERVPIDSIREYNEYHVSVNQQTPFGTNIVLSSTITDEYNDSPVEFAHTASISATQALLRGMLLSVNTANIKRARLDSDMSQQRFEFLSARIANEAERAFWNYTLAKRELEIVKKNGEVINSRLAKIQAEFEMGIASRVELAQIEAEVAEYAKRAIDAQGSKDQAKLNLLHIMGKLSVANRNLVVKIESVPQVNWVKPDAIEDHIEAGIRFRQDVKEAEILVERNEVELVQTRDGLLPRLDFFIDLSATSYASSFTDTDVLGDPEIRRFSAGLALNLPILKTDARVRHTQSKYRAEQAAIALENMKNLVVLDITRAHGAVESSIKLIEAAQKSFEARELFFRMQSEKFEMNQISTFEYLQSARDFMQSEIELERAKIAYALSLNNLHFLDGTLLKREGL